MSTDYRRAFGAWFSEQLRGRPYGYRRQLALAIGTDPGNISHWADGANLPRRSVCLALAKALGQPVDRVLLLAGHAPEGNPERIYRTLTSTLTGHQTRAKEVAL